MPFCGRCGANQDPHLKFCSACGTPVSEPAWAPPPAPRQWNPGIAAVLSFFIPGLGQIYKGQIGQGLAWLICTPIAYVALIVPGVILHIICIYNAYNGRAN